MYDFSGAIFGIVIIAAIALLIFACFCMGILADSSIAEKALEVQGFSNISVVEKDWLFVQFKGGAQDDNVKFTATATNPAGNNVTVYVYAGWPFKGGTIRT
jgi:hypothetical protein